MEVAPLPNYVPSLRFAWEPPQGGETSSKE
jgi:hypothetical protein